MNIIAWLILGGIASDSVASIARPGTQHGRLNQVALGTLASVTFGYLAGLIVGMKDPILGELEPAALAAAVVAAAVTSAVVAALRGRATPH